MNRSRPSLRLLFLVPFLAVMPPACAPARPDAPEDPARRGSHALEQCATGLSLGTERPSGPGKPSEVTLTGNVLGELDERSPTPLRYLDTVTTSATGTTRGGWVFHAHAGEAFTFEDRPSGSASYAPLPMRIYGPVDGCASTSMVELARTKLASPQGFTAPADGDYFVALWHPTSVDQAGKLTAQPTDSARYVIYPRRLGEDGHPAVHHFDPVASWRAGVTPDVPILRAFDAAFADMDGDGDLEIVASTFLYAGSSKRTFDVLVLDQDSTGAWHEKTRVQNCLGEGGDDSDPGQLVIADFDGDGRPDVFTGTSRLGRELFVSQPDGSLACHPESPALSWSERQAGAVDLDGDGDLDLVAIDQSYAGESETHAWVRFAMNDGHGNFTSPPVQKIDHGAGGLVWRTGVTDVDGDGRLDLVIETHGKTDAISAWTLPGLQKIPTDPSLLETLDPHRMWMKRTDLDGDGFLDEADAMVIDWSRQVLGVSYGRDDGSKTGTWFFLPETSDGGYQDATIDTADVDGDGCPDVLLGGRGIELYRGHGCVKKELPPEQSCVDACGGISADETCWCDDVCTYYGDCCADQGEVCGGQ